MRVNYNGHVTRPREFRCFKQDNIEALASQCSGGIAARRSTSDHQDLSMLSSLSSRLSWVLGWALTEGMGVGAEESMGKEDRSRISRWGGVFFFSIGVVPLLK